MATTDSTGIVRWPDVRLGLTIVCLGAFAALGSVLVALGVTDVLAFADGYRPGHWVVADYARALAVTAAGWSLLVAVGYSTIQAALAPA